MIEEDDDTINAGRVLFSQKPMSQMHKVYLCGTIKRPEEYTEIFETIRNAGEQDVVYIHINSEGGFLFSAIQFLRVLGETKATVIASVEGLCMSAATLIFMAAKHHEITNHSMFMFHNYSNKVEGKGGELLDHIIHTHAWGERLLRDMYASFLTEDEIKFILNGKDLYLTSEEVANRLERRNAKIAELAQKSAETVVVNNTVPEIVTPKKKGRGKKRVLFQVGGSKS